MIPSGAGGIVLFAHVSGSSRHSPSNQYVARVIREAGIGALLFEMSDGGQIHYLHRHSQ
jgi:putative phosphoribosyl transferase